MDIFFLKCTLSSTIQAFSCVILDIGTVIPELQPVNTGGNDTLKLLTTKISRVGHCVKNDNHNTNGTTLLG